MTKQNLAADANEEAFREKARLRHELANLSFEEKLLILVDLQRVAKAMAESAGREPCTPWEVRYKNARVSTKPTERL